MGSDLKAIWEGLETGRLDWLNAAARAHALKVKLRDALKRDKNSGEGECRPRNGMDVRAALNVPGLKQATQKWAEVAKIETMESPLVGYQSSLWTAGRPRGGLSTLVCRRRLRGRHEFRRGVGCVKNIAST